MFKIQFDGKTFTPEDLYWYLEEEYDYRQLTEEERDLLVLEMQELGKVFGEDFINAIENQFSCIDDFNATVQ